MMSYILIRIQKFNIDTVYYKVELFLYDIYNYLIYFKLALGRIRYKSSNNTKLYKLL